VDNINTDIIFLGVFLVTLVLAGFIAFAIHMFSAPRQKMKGRLDKFRTQYVKSPLGKSSTKSVLLTSAKTTSFDQLIKRLLPNPAELRARLMKTGINITLTQYVMATVFSVLITYGLFKFLAGASFILALLLAVFIGVLLPHIIVGSIIKKRLTAFTKLFPDAIDLIVRGLKSGLPITETIQSVGKEIDEPVTTEFKKIMDYIKLGKTMEEALWIAADRVDTPEFKFFVISLSIQKETGGNLGETLEKLSEVLRRRQQMKLKVKAMSSEGKASAYIVGALPFVMFGMLLMINYDYASVLFTDPRAIMSSIVGLVWMMLGGLIMAKMISFEI